MYEDVSARLKIQHLIPFFSTVKHKVSNRNRWRRRDFSLGKRIRAPLYSRQIGKAWSHFYRRRENKPRVLEYCTDFFVPSEFCERWSFKKPEKQQIELHRRYSFSQTLTGALGSTVYVLFLGSLPRYVVWTTVIGTSDLDAPSTNCLLNSKFLFVVLQDPSIFTRFLSRAEPPRETRWSWLSNKYLQIIHKGKNIKKGQTLVSSQPASQSASQPLGRLVSWSLAVTW